MNKKSLFLFDFKKMWLIPSGAYVLFTLAMIVLGLFRIGNVDYLQKVDNIANVFLIVYFAIVIITELIKAKNNLVIYKKYGVSRERIFLYKILQISIFLSIYVLTNLVLGSIRVKLNGEEIARLLPLIFSFQGKVWWYFLFAFSVSMSGMIVFSVVVIIYQIFEENSKIVFKILKLILFGLLFYVAVASIKSFIDASFLTMDGFTYSLPVGNFAYKEIVKGYYDHQSVVADYIASYDRLLKCLVAWDITNLITLGFGLLIIVLAFLSFSYVERNQNNCRNREIRL